ncbi:MAG: peptidylprolyl isomerase [Chloroflexota bacterium]
MLDRVRSWVGIGESATVPGGHRRLTRRERELRQRRVLYILTAVAAAAVALTLIIGAVYQYIIVPRETYATVNGVDIRREEYEKRRTYDLLQEVTSLSQQLQAGQQQGQQPGQQDTQQIQQQLELAQIELQDLDNDEKNIDPESLKLMVEDQLILQSLDDFGIVLSDDEVDDFVNELLAPVPLEEPTETPTVHPTAEAWATQTFEEQVDAATATAEGQETANAEEQDGEDESDEDSDEGEATEAPEEDLDDDADATGTPEAEATAGDAEGTAEETQPVEEEDLEDLATIDPEATPGEGEDAEPTATLSRDDAIGTAEANFDLLEDNFLERADMSRSDFERLVARPALARERIREILQSEVESEAEQVRASHILVSTEDAAQELIDGRLQDEDFESVAADVSIDTGTVDNGGDLGWFPRGVMADAFEEAAFDLEVDEMTEEPVQTEFGWHVILVTDREEDRPLTVNMLNTLKQAVLDNWLEEQLEEADISSEVPLPEDEQPPANLGAPGQGQPGQGIPGGQLP